MNIQDIADFIDLVKNPAKYEQILKNLQDEQARLNAVIETVGKASELDSLRKSVEKQQSKLEQSYKAKQEKLDADYQSKLDALTALQSTVEKESEKAHKISDEANSIKVSTEETAKSFVLREKELRKQEDAVEKLKQELGASVVEYNEKLAKLRSVMA
jgi:chromosome segregation ATPase